MLKRHFEMHPGAQLFASRADLAHGADRRSRSIRKPGTKRTPRNLRTQTLDPHSVEHTCPPAPDFIEGGFESGIARLTSLSRDPFALAYFRHTGKGEVMYLSVSLSEAVESVKTDPWFECF